MGTETIITDKKTTHNLVTFRLGRQTCALPIEPIVQIIPMVTIIPVPKTDTSILGVINVHGKLVPVVSLHRAFSLPEVSFHLYTPILLIESNSRTVGLIVDDVLDVIPVPGEEIRHPIDLIPEEFAVDSIINGLINTPKGMIILLDVEHLFLPTQDLAMTEAWNLTMTEEAPGSDGKEVVPENVDEPEKIEPIVAPDSITMTTNDGVPASTPTLKKSKPKRKKVDQVVKKEQESVENNTSIAVLEKPAETEAVIEEPLPKVKTGKKRKKK
jgi:purine-binding chemotaxis protein CheW